MIAAKVANALALDYPRRLLEVIVASDGSSDAHRRAGPGGRRRSRPRPAAGRQGRGPERRRRGGLGRRARLLGRQLPLGGRVRCARLVAPLADQGVGYACGQVRFTDDGGREPRGRLLALRDGGPPPRVRARRGHRRQRRRSTRSAARPTSRFGLPAATTSPSRSSWPSGAAIASTSRTALAEERMVPTLEGELRRKRRMMVGLWDIVIGEGMVSPARLPAALRASRSPPTGSSATRPRSSTCWRWRRTSPCSATGSSTRSPWPCSWR